MEWVTWILQNECDYHEMDKQNNPPCKFSFQMAKCGKTDGGKKNRRWLKIKKNFGKIEDLWEKKRYIDKCAKRNEAGSQSGEITLLIKSRNASSSVLAQRLSITKREDSGNKKLDVQKTRNNVVNVSATARPLQGGVAKMDMKKTRINKKKRKKKNVYELYLNMHKEMRTMRRDGGEEGKNESDLYGDRDADRDADQDVDRDGNRVGNRLADSEAVIDLEKEVKVRLEEQTNLLSIKGIDRVDIKQKKGKHSVICIHYIKNMCMKNLFCNYLHQLIYSRIPTCKNYVKYNYCADKVRGSCLFRHSVENTNASTNASTNTNTNTNTNNYMENKDENLDDILKLLHEKNICVNYLLGFCNLGYNCRKVHKNKSRKYINIISFLPKFYLDHILINKRLYAHLYNNQKKFQNDMNKLKDALIVLSGEKFPDKNSTLKNEKENYIMETLTTNGNNLSNNDSYNNTVSSNRSNIANASNAENVLLGSNSSSVCISFGAGMEENAENVNLLNSNIRCSQKGVTTSYSHGGFYKNMTHIESNMEEKYLSKKNNSVMGNHANDNACNNNRMVNIISFGEGRGVKGRSVEDRSVEDRSVEGRSVEGRSVEGRSVEDIGVEGNNERIEISIPNVYDLNNNPIENNKVKVFVIKCNQISHLYLSILYGVWATGKNNTRKFVNLFKENYNIIFLFSVNESGGFQGYAKMITMPIKNLYENLWGPITKRLGGNFRIQWIKIAKIDFDIFKGIVNPYNDNLPLKKSRDGTELPLHIGSIICNKIHSLPNEDFLAGTIYEYKRRINHSSYFTNLHNQNLLNTNTMWDIIIFNLNQNSDCQKITFINGTEQSIA
ncbi:YTH domain-containing protein, putative [Plasmodium ovale curtisi]|uniref:YTH domain-containing protein, putative n=1 Tax=Plasmodium ovale curtisi TaxID=864141 RepID=A0A1A8W661_PLAOA|nr:YTH domain-containing protein, putative [Plasmodium ovale curtisi]